MEVLGYLVNIILLILVCVAAYFATRFLSRKTSAMMRGKNMQVIDKIILSNDRSIILVKSGSKVLMIGITGHSMQTLGEFDPDEFEISEPTKIEPSIMTKKFSEILNNVMTSAGLKKGNKEDE